VDVQDSKSLGLKLVNILVGQLKGSMQVHRESGTQFKIEFEWRPVAGQSLA
jgi:two-component sensor histidine kinase